MHRSPRFLLAAAVACVAATGGTAHAQGPYTLSLAGPPSATVGQPVVLQASGANPADEDHLTLDVHVIPADVMPSCPADFLQSLSMSSTLAAQGGDWIATSQREGAGAWSMPLAWSPGTAGKFIVCGYTHDIAYTLAAASLPLTVQGAPPVTTPGPGGVTTGGGGGAAPAPPAPAPVPRGTSRPAPAARSTAGATPKAPKLTRRFRIRRGFTTFSVLRIQDVPAGSSVTAKCSRRGKRCRGKARRAFTKRNASGTVSLSRFTKTRLAPGTVITVRVTGPGGTTIKRITIRRGTSPKVV